MIAPPPIDPRRAPEIVAQLRRLFPEYVPEWPRRPGDRWPAGDPGAALAEIFARFGEVATERLNRVPEKQFLVFLDMLGITLLPSSEARAPIQFFPAAGATVDPFVRRETPLATAGADPQTFETERDLYVSRARIARAVTFDPRTDRSTDYSASLAPSGVEASSGLPAFVGTTLIDHVLYIAYDAVLRGARPSFVGVEIQFTAPLDPAIDAFLRSLSWWARVGGQPQRLAAAAVVGGDTLFVNMINVAGIESWTVAGTTAHWIWAKTEQPMTWPGRGFPTVTAVRLSSGSASPEPPELVISKGSPLDLSQGAFVFADKPKVGDTFYIKSAVFGRTGAGITLSIEVQFPINLAPARPVSLRWEFWNGTLWQELGTANEAGPDTPTGTFQFRDTSHAFTLAGARQVQFQCPPSQPTQVGSESGLWLRVRILSGDYGEDGKLTPTRTPPPALTLEDWIYTPPSFRPPFVINPRLGHNFGVGQNAQAAVRRNGFVVEPVSLVVGHPPFRPFEPPPDVDPVLALGWDHAFSNRPISVFFAVGEQTEPPTGTSVVWRYWNGAAWERLGLLREETKGLLEPGVLVFLGPVDLARADQFGADLFWIQGQLSGENATRFSLSGIHPNVTWAQHATTIRDEVIGSSNGKPGQIFTASRSPVLPGQSLEIREPEIPPADEIAELVAEGEVDPVRIIRDDAGRPREIWVRWHEVDHFQLSGPHSRHYIVDRARSQYATADDRHGRIPPPGRDNVRLSQYRAGGGRAGNVAAGTITVLKRAVPSVDRVNNPYAAGGGADLEHVEAVKDRGPLVIKHRNRAVTAEDYESLARQASRQVVRAKALPARDATTAGKVSVLIVPEGGPRPMPSPGLLRRVKSYLDARRLPTADITLFGPTYIDVLVNAQVAPSVDDDVDAVRQRVADALTAFLHPLTGGPGGQGWDFGRDVYISEVAELIEGIDGVDHLVTATLQGFAGVDDRTRDAGKRVEIRADAGELVASGVHTVTLVL
jgi:uncharacterized phage protein gp47/JayE